MGNLPGDTAAVTASLDRLCITRVSFRCGPRSWRTKIYTDLRTDHALAAGGKHQRSRYVAWNVSLTATESSVEGSETR
jgi:hypothetical protein